MAQCAHHVVLMVADVVVENDSAVNDGAKMGSSYEDLVNLRIIVPTIKFGKIRRPFSRAYWEIQDHECRRARNPFSPMALAVFSPTLPLRSPAMKIYTLL